MSSDVIARKVLLAYWREASHRDGLSPFVLAELAVTYIAEVKNVC